MDQKESKETHYTPCYTEQNHQSSSAPTTSDQPVVVPSEQPQNEKDEEVKTDNKCTCCAWLGYVAVITYTVLTLIFGILFIVLTAVGKENISIHKGSTHCSCELFVPAVGYLLGVIQLIEVGLLVGIPVIFMLGFCVEGMINFLLYYCFVAGGLLVINFFCFLCTTLAAIVFVAMGGMCCSTTSVVVASLSGVIAAFKLVIFYVSICHEYFHRSD